MTFSVSVGWQRGPLFTFPPLFCLPLSPPLHSSCLLFPLLSALLFLAWRGLLETRVGTWKAVFSLTVSGRHVVLKLPLNLGHTDLWLMLPKTWATKGRAWESWQIKSVARG